MNRRNDAYRSPYQPIPLPMLSKELKPPPATPQPLAGVRILDLTRLLPGAWCTQLLADMGAEVVKVEQPVTGDYWRWMEPKVKQQGYAFLALNRGKKSITQIGRAHV